MVFFAAALVILDAFASDANNSRQSAQTKVQINNANQPIITAVKHPDLNVDYSMKYNPYYLTLEQNEFTIIVTNAGDGIPAFANGLTTSIAPKLQLAPSEGSSLPAPRLPQPEAAAGPGPPAPKVPLSPAAAGSALRTLPVLQSASEAEHWLIRYPPIVVEATFFTNYVIPWDMDEGDALDCDVEGWANNVTITCYFYGLAQGESKNFTVAVVNGPALGTFSNPYPAVIPIPLGEIHVDEYWTKLHQETFTNNNGQIIMEEIPLP